MLKKILLGIMALIATAAIGMLLLSLATLITGEGPGIYEILILIIVALMAPFGFYIYRRPKAQPDSIKDTP